MALHLHAVESDNAGDVVTAAKVDAVFFVIQRQNGHWSPAAKIMNVFLTEYEAEQSAAALKDLHPQQHYGVAVLRSEARYVAKPIEIVRAVEPPCDVERPQA
jgi:hypothetical protein